MQQLGQTQLLPDPPTNNLVIIKSPEFYFIFFLIAYSSYFAVSKV